MLEVVSLPAVPAKSSTSKDIAPRVRFFLRFFFSFLLLALPFFALPQSTTTCKATKPIAASMSMHAVCRKGRRTWR